MHRLGCEGQEKEFKSVVEVRLHGSGLSHLVTASLWAFLSKLFGNLSMTDVKFNWAHWAAAMS